MTSTASTDTVSAAKTIYALQAFWTTRASPQHGASLPLILETARNLCKLIQ